MGYAWPTPAGVWDMHGPHLQGYGLGVRGGKVMDSECKAGFGKGDFMISGAQLDQLEPKLEPTPTTLL